jgi:hypothetical protein
MPKGSGFEQPADAPPGDWRDPAIFDELDTSVAAEDRREKKARTGRAKGNRSVATHVSPTFAVQARFGLNWGGSRK